MDDIKNKLFKVLGIKKENFVFIFNVIYGLNLVVYFLKFFFNKGDEIVLINVEYVLNILFWYDIYE